MERFVSEFKQMQGVKLTYGNRVIANLSLAGTFAAATELEACQVAMLAGNEPKSGSDDPLVGVGAGAGANDPFSQ